jgi:hypothetical protein
MSIAHGQITENVNPNPEWITRGKSIRQLIEELLTFADLDMEVRMSIDDADTFHHVSIVGRHYVKVGYPNVIYFCGLRSLRNSGYVPRPAENFIDAKKVDIGEDYNIETSLTFQQPSLATIEDISAELTTHNPVRVSNALIAIGLDETDGARSMTLITPSLFSDVDEIVSAAFIALGHLARRKVFTDYNSLCYLLAVMPTPSTKLPAYIQLVEDLNFYHSESVINELATAL